MVVARARSRRRNARGHGARLSEALFPLEPVGLATPPSAEATPPSAEAKRAALSTARTLAATEYHDRQAPAAPLGRREVRRSPGATMLLLGDGR
jgi:hypothetical protein